MQFSRPSIDVSPKFFVTRLFRAAMQVAMLLAVTLMVAGDSAKAAYVDWTNINTTLETAVGTLNGITVNVSGTDIFGGDTNGTDTRFNFPSVFLPSESPTDSVIFLSGVGSPNSYTVTFLPAVTDPVFHFQSMASTLRFSTPANTLQKELGDTAFMVNPLASTVVGSVTPTAPVNNDTNGSVLVKGTYNSITFTSTSGLLVSGADGIAMQISAIPEPSSGILLLVGLFGSVAINRKRNRS